MITLKKEFTFEAAHKLPKHDGKCARLHGHSWKMRIVFEGFGLQGQGPQTGMLVDYARISAVVKPFIEEKLDHHYLNETTGLEDPTSEKLAIWIYQQLAPKFQTPFFEGAIFRAVEIDETCTSSCCFTQSHIIDAL
jgi:6-pyruvoyltetrahydropterin/6-carboxytetrahydropterin synthase